MKAPRSLTPEQQLAAALAYAGRGGKPMSLTEFGVEVGYNAQYARREFLKGAEGRRPVVEKVEEFIARHLGVAA